MKTMGKSIFNGLAGLFVLFIISIAPADGAQVQKTFTWKYPVGSDTRVVFTNYNCDLVIHVWNKSETEYHLTIEATGKSEDDEARLLRYLGNYTFSHSGSSVNFRNTFWKNRRSINGRTTLEIEGEKNIELTEFDMKGELWIPASNPLEMDSKYSRIDLEDFAGKLSLTLYNDNVYGGNLTAAAEISAKYANIEFKEIKGLKAEFYNCDFEAGNAGDLTINSKYSKFDSKTAGNVMIDSYNDKFSFEKTGDIIFSSKYSDLKTGNTGNFTIDCYNGTIIAATVNKMKLSSKYADFQIRNTGDILIGDSYNDKFHFGKVNSMKIDVSKYSIYEAEELSETLSESDGYNDNFTISKIGAGMKEISINGKYTEISLGMPVSLDYRLKANIKYPTFEINETAFKTRVKVVENSGMQYDGVKGTEKDGMPVIEVKGYNMTLKISDLK